MNANNVTVVMNSHLVGAIITLLKGYKASSDDEKRKNDYKYLASQCIRQYALADDHYHVSVAAKKLWDELTSDKIELRFYRDKVKCDKLLWAKTVMVFTGARHKGKRRTLHKNDTIVFNSLFQGDHVVPVSFIFNKLSNLADEDRLSPDSVTQILNQMHICKITKMEDHKMGRTRNRSMTFEEVITKGVYHEAGIVLVEDEYIKNHVKE